MAIYKNDIVDINLETGNIHRAFLNRAIGMTDNVADHFGVRVWRNGEAVSLSGVSVQGYFRDPRGNNIAITSGNIVSGNEAVVVLPQACYNYEGQFCLAIKLVGGGVTGTMRIVDGVVSQTNTGGAVAPTSAVPTYQEVLAQYDAMVAATAAANGAIAPLYANLTFPVKTGQYAIVDGALKRAIVDIATSEAYTAAHWTDAKIGPDVSDLKSAIDAIVSSNDPITFTTYTAGKYITSYPGMEGDLLTDEGFHVSTRAVVKPGEIVKAENVYCAGYKAIAWYDSSNEFGGILVTGTSEKTVFFTIPNNARYIRATALATDSVVFSYASIINEDCKAYENVSKMKNATMLKNGDICKTLGYYSKSDGGSAFYIISSSQPSGFYETLSNGLYAELILEDDVNVMNYGCYGNGTTNDTTAFVNAVNVAISSGKRLISPSGKTYLLNHIDIDSPISIYFNNSTVKNNSEGYVLAFGKQETGDYTHFYDVQMLVVDCNNGYGIKLDTCSSDMFSDITILNVGNHGLYVTKSFGVFFNRIFIQGSQSGATGLRIATHDLHFTDITIIDCQTAIFLDENTSGNYYTRIHAWIDNYNLFNGSKFAHVAGYCNCVFEDCYIDNYHYGVYLDYTWSAITFNNCYLLIGSTMWQHAESPGYLVYNNKENSYGTSRIRFLGLRAESLVFQNMQPYNTCNFTRNFIIDCALSGTTFSDDVTPYKIDYPVLLSDGNTDSNSATLRFQNGIMYIIYDGPIESNFTGDLFEVNVVPNFREFIPKDQTKIIPSFYSHGSADDKNMEPYYTAVTIENTQRRLKLSVKCPDQHSEETIFAHINIAMPMSRY